MPQKRNRQETETETNEAVRSESSLVGKPDSSEMKSSSKSKSENSSKMSEMKRTEIEYPGEPLPETDVNESEDESSEAESDAEEVGERPGAKRARHETVEADSAGADTDKDEKVLSFSELGICDELVNVLKTRKWEQPTPIQVAAIPAALKGRDIIGLAVTGSGKTGAFCIPIVQGMLEAKSLHPFYALVVTPTRELCVQIANEFRILSGLFQIRIATIMGGVDSVSQTKDLARLPHFIAATPGRLVEQLENTKGFTLDRLEFLVLDEADRLLSDDFEESLQKIIKASNDKRQTFLFSATMTSKVSKLQRISLTRPVRVSVDKKTATALNLTQYMVLLHPEEKFQYLTALLRKFNAYRIMVFCNTCKIANVLSIYLQKLNFSSAALSGDMVQTSRFNALNKFKNGQVNILLTTEVAGRGMDLPDVNYVVNFDVPSNHKDYIHRVGRTARAGNHGSCFTFVTKFDVQQYKLIENKVFGENCDKDKLPKKFQEIHRNDYDFHNVKQAKNEAEKEYDSQRNKKHFKKRKNP